MAEAFDVSGVPCGPRPVIDYPGTETVEWYGFKRHNFELNGFSGFIVEPPNPAPAPAAEKKTDGDSESNSDSGAEA